MDKYKLLFLVTLLIRGSISSGTPVTGWHLALGGGVAKNQMYEGSSTYRTQFSPHLDLKVADTFFLNFDDGLGLNLYNKGETRVAVSVNYFEGRFERHDRDNLAGLGDIDSAAIGVVHAEHVLGFVAPFLNVSKYFGDIDGVKAKVGLGTALPLDASTLLVLSAGYEWADAEYHNVFFGVNPSQAQASGLIEYSGRSGFKSKFVDFGLQLAVAKHWAIHAQGSYSLLLGDAAGSPLVKEKSALTGRLLLVYNF